MTTWDPQQYLQFDQERLRPALDLLAQIQISDPETIVDLGCGPGTVTQILKHRWPNAKITGIDHSTDMLEKAQRIPEDIFWQEADISTWQAEKPVDLIFSNACLHWLGDHKQLFAHLLKQLKPGGLLAVQMPRNFDQPSHTLIADILGADHPLCPGIPVHALQVYYDWVAPLCQDLRLWETRYIHILEGENPVADWTKGAALRPILEGLSPDAARIFEGRYRHRVQQAYFAQEDGKTLFPFKRLFLIAQA